MHELKLIVDLMYRGGLNFMRFSVSDTAEFGDYVSGPRVTEGAKAAMKDVLSDIQSGSFAERWINEYDSGGEQFKRLRQQDRDHQIEQVGAELRSKMPFLDPVTVEAGQAQAAATRTPAGVELRHDRRRTAAGGPFVPAGSVRIFDTTLRDGEQAPARA
jgi:ketol-acid reductoisomerase